MAGSRGTVSDEDIKNAVQDSELERLFRETVVRLIEQHESELDYTAFKVGMKLAYRLSKEAN